MQTRTWIAEANLCKLRENLEELSLHHQRLPELMDWILTSPKPRVLLRLFAAHTSCRLTLAHVHAGQNQKIIKTALRYNLWPRGLNLLQCCCAPPVVCCRIFRHFVKHSPCASESRSLCASFRSGDPNLLTKVIRIIFARGSLDAIEGIYLQLLEGNISNTHSNRIRKTFETALCSDPSMLQQLLERKSVTQKLTWYGPFGDSSTLLAIAVSQLDMSRIAKYVQEIRLLISWTDIIRMGITPQNLRFMLMLCVADQQSVLGVLRETAFRGPDTNELLQVLLDFRYAGFSSVDASFCLFLLLSRPHPISARVFEWLLNYVPREQLRIEHFNNFLRYHYHGEFEDDLLHTFLTHIHPPHRSWALSKLAEDVSTRLCFNPILDLHQFPAETELLLRSPIRLDICACAYQASIQNPSVSLKVFYQSVFCSGRVTFYHCNRQALNSSLSSTSSSGAHRLSETSPDCCFTSLFAHREFFTTTDSTMSSERQQQVLKLYQILHNEKRDVYCLCCNAKYSLMFRINSITPFRDMFLGLVLHGPDSASLVDADDDAIQALVVHQEHVARLVELKGGNFPQRFHERLLSSCIRSGTHHSFIALYRAGFVLLPPDAGVLAFKRADTRLLGFLLPRCWIDWTHEHVRTFLQSHPSCELLRNASLEVLRQGSCFWFARFPFCLLELIADFAELQPEEARVYPN